MQELVGRLTALDAEATESLKVIAYFDALVNGHASVEVLLRGAAVLSGCAAGVDADGTRLRVDAAGARAPAGDGDWPQQVVSDGGRAWIERVGRAHANDEMILERLAIALGIALDRTSPVAASRRALETLIDGSLPVERRIEAAERLRLDAHSLHRVTVVPAASVAPAPSTVVTTRVGSVRVSVSDSRGLPPHALAGIGIATATHALDRSWASGLIALRLTSDREPTLCADDLGSMLLLAEAADVATAESPDVAALRALLQSHPKALGLLDAVASAESLRAVATELGLHHSTVQARVADYAAELGFDVRSGSGRVRLALALALLRLATNRFE